MRRRKSFLIIMETLGVSLAVIVSATILSLGLARAAFMGLKALID